MKKENGKCIVEINDRIHMRDGNIGFVNVTVKRIIFQNDDGVLFEDENKRLRCWNAERAGEFVLNDSPVPMEVIARIITYFKENLENYSYFCI